MLQSGPLCTASCEDARSAKFNFQQCSAADIRHMSEPTATSELNQLPVHSQEVASPSAAGNAVTKLANQREGVESSALGVDGRQGRSGQSRHGKPPLPPAKDRRRTPASSTTVLSSKKTSSSTSDKADCSEWTAASRRHQHQKQHHRKKTETSSTLSLYSQKPLSVTSATPLAFQPAQHGLHPAVTTTAPASAPLFTALPAAGVLLHGALPVNARRCDASCPGAVLQPPHHQHLLVAEQPTAPPCSRLYRAGPSTSRPAGTTAGWRYATTAPAVARPHPALCREYLLVGPSSFLLLR